ncbi:MAG: molybdenum cofactor guanylyltransferase MobA [Maritimibacter sp.]
MKKPVGVIVAGGQGRRMNGLDKPLAPLAGRTMIAHVAERLAPQVDALAINANGDLDRFGLPFPVISDDLPGQPGPLVGILTAMRWAEAQGASQVVTMPADTPFLPGDVVERLARGIEINRGSIAVAADESGVHPVAAIWPTIQEATLARAIEAGLRRVMEFTDLHNATIVHFSGEPFFNINTPDDLAKAQARAMRAE